MFQVMNKGLRQSIYRIKCSEVAKLFCKQESVIKLFKVTMSSQMKMLARFNFRNVTSDGIKLNTEKLISSQRLTYDKIGSVPLNEVNYDNVIMALANVMYEKSNEGGPLYFPQHAADDKALRDASCAAETKLEEFEVEMSMRKDIFDRIVAFKENIGTDSLDPEAKRFVEKLIRMGKRNGLHLSEETRNKLKEIKTRMSEISINFSKNLNEENSKHYFTKEELAGMPDDFVNELKEVDGKLEVTLKYPHLFPITKKCQVPNTRKVMTQASQSQCIEENTPIIEELIKLRQTQADLLGYPNHATYIHEERMAGSPEKVASFLSELSDKLQILWKDELGVLNSLKKNQCEKYGYENSGKVEYWDIKYYMNVVEETVYAVDEEQIRQYFPLEKVTSGLLHIYQQLLGLKFHLESDFKAWNDDVLLYSVTDAKTSIPMGYFFLDLHPREGKFGHAAVFPLQPSCITADGSRQPSICAMMCNFTKPTKEKPALLTHSEVETFFHEFGHAMHNVCAQTQFSLFAGTNTEQDFLEAPSQMLENWVWETEPLRLMSAHFRTGEPLPDSLIEKLAASRKANAGGFNLRQIVLSTFDQRIHTRAKADTAQLFAQTYEDIMGVSPIPGTNMPASFGHLAGGYDAQYYGYLWSEVFAMDMYESRFKKGGILSPVVGMDYRMKILFPGGSKDGSVMLKEFLGRDPTHDAFLRSKGL